MNPWVAAKTVSALRSTAKAQFRWNTTETVVQCLSATGLPASTLTDPPRRRRRRRRRVETAATGASLLSRIDNALLGSLPSSSQHRLILVTATDVTTERYDAKLPASGESGDNAHDCTRPCLLLPDERYRDFSLERAPRV